ncbi:MAG: glycoside hydrolase family 30 protein [Rhizomicrobium sp.]
MKIISSTRDAPWQSLEAQDGDGVPDLSHGPVVTPNFKGFGICFNELGWNALSLLNSADRDHVLNLLFNRQTGCGFSYNRVPIGASDFSTGWYSHNEAAGDFEMANFSVARDEVALIPYLCSAQTILGDRMILFASPWCPPTWMKTPPVYNFGGLTWEPKYRKAYADYLVCFVNAYEALGIRVDAIHVQNEPDSNQKFPSCLWTGAKLRDFIRDDLGPAFRSASLDTQIWLGTIERGSFNDWVAPTLYDPVARGFLSGIGFQWAGKNGIQRAHQAAPELPLIQTENECGDGSNTWDYTHYVFDLIQHYVSNGVEAYVYWNAVLEHGGVSTWGWRQNSLFCVDPETRVAVANPEFHLMRHLSGFVRPGAAVLESRGLLRANGICFRNADGAHVSVLQNPSDAALPCNLALGDETVRVELPPRSFTTFAE